MNLTDRLITEIVEKCDGLSITAEQASNILAYLQCGAPLPREAETVRLAALKDAENIARLFDLGTPDGHAIADAIRKLAAAANGEQGVGS